MSDSLLELENSALNCSATTAGLALTLSVIKYNNAYAVYIVYTLTMPTPPTLLNWKTENYKIENLTNCKEKMQVWMMPLWDKWVLMIALQQKIAH